MGEYLPSPWDLSCEDLKGSILLPFLFNIMNILGKTVHRFGVGCYWYSDDSSSTFVSLLTQVSKSQSFLSAWLQFGLDVSEAIETESRQER